MSSDAEFHRLWENAIDAYLDSTNRSETEQAVLREITTFEQLRVKLEHDHGNFTAFRKRFSSFIRNVRNFTLPLDAIAAIGSNAVALSPFAPASSIFGAVTLLVNAGKNVSQAYDWIEELFERLGNFTLRLNEYCTVGVLSALGSKVAQILGCLLEILGQSEKAVKTGRFKRYLKEVARFLRDNDNVKASFDKLTELFNNEQGIVLAINYATTQVLDKRTQEIQKLSGDVLETVKRNELQLDKIEKAERADADSRRREQILNWISSIDFADLQNDILLRRQDHTGKWFLAADEFQTWLNTAKQTLFCPGMPGAGKTFMASTAIDHLSHNRTDDMGLAYLFYTYKPRSEGASQLCLTSLSVILKQLVRPLSSVPLSVKQLYEGLTKEQRRPNVDNILNCLSAVCEQYAGIYVVVDALDECDPGNRKRFLDNLFTLQQEFDVRLLFTSRDVPEVTEMFNPADNPNLQSLEVYASEDDIKLYVEHQLPSLARSIQKDKNLQREVLEKVSKAAQGMFLVAELHIGSLRGILKPSQVRAALERLSSNDLNDLYAAAIHRVDQQEPSERQLAWRAFSWIRHAFRELKAGELRHVLSLEPDMNSISDADLYELEDIISACVGLVTYDQTVGVVRFIHYTTQKYFESIDWKIHSEVDIALDCIAYLSLEPFQSGGCENFESFRSRLQNYAFSQYVFANWVDHLRLVQSETQDAAASFLGNKNLTDSVVQAEYWIWAVRAFESFGRAPREVIFPSGISGLHLTAKHGLVHLTRLLIFRATHRGGSLDPEDESGRTPLLLAIQHGHAEIVSLLFDTGKMSVNTVYRNHEFDRKRPFRRQYWNGWTTPLIQAAIFGQLEVVNLLLDRGALVEWAEIDQHGQSARDTALHAAAFNGHENVVERLLDPSIGVKVDPDARDAEGNTPLAMAAINGHFDILKLLLDSGRVNAELQNNEGWTPLIWATRRGHHQAAKLLMNFGVDTDFGGGSMLPGSERAVRLRENPEGE